MLKQLENFDNAFQHLSTSWENSSPEVKEAMQTIVFPFHKSLDEMCEEVHYWVESCIENIKDLIPYTYAVCREDNGTFTRSHFYETKKLGNTIEVFEGFERDLNFDELSEDEFKKYFFTIPKEMYDLYYLLSANGEGFEEIQKLAFKLYDEGGEE